METPRALLPLADGFEDIEAITVIDVLRRGGVEVVTASIHGRPEIRSAHSVIVHADAPLEEVIDEDFDAIILPGGSEGAEHLGNCEPLIGRLHAQREDGGLVCAICAAPLILERAGLLDEDQQVTCYPSLQEELDREWSPQPVVEHDGIITGQAPGASMLFALVVLKALTDEENAARVAEGMVTDVFGE